eukprot:1185932-Prorocentrum_minimum.AAC.3
MLALWSSRAPTVSASPAPAAATSAVTPPRVSKSAWGRAGGGVAAQGVSSRGQQEVGGVSAGGKYRYQSSADAREPQNPTRASCPFVNDRKRSCFVFPYLGAEGEQREHPLHQAGGAGSVDQPGVPLGVHVLGARPALQKGHYRRLLPGLERHHQRRLPVAVLRVRVHAVLAQHLAVYTQRENQSQEGRQRISSMRTSRRRGGSIHSTLIASVRPSCAARPRAVKLDAGRMPGGTSPGRGAHTWLPATFASSST